MIARLTKRSLDIAGSLFGLLLTSPATLAISVAVWTKLGRPILFRQRRPGIQGRLFTLYKFRTMLPMSPESESATTDAARLTPLGNLLRRASLDELPELVNVLKGDMSLVGPRPLLPEYLSRYSPEQARRHLMRPGVTGWAQVNGRNALSWEEKFVLDLWYVDNWSLGLDFKIIWMTFKEVVMGRGVSARGHATMPPFMGTEETTDA
jgi:sugar transferase EpsL